MRPRMNRVLAGYILAGVAMLVLFLYLRFPGEMVTDYIKAAAARYPRMTLSLDTARSAIPPGVHLEKITAGFQGRPEATLQADRLTIRPRWFSLLRGRFAFLLAAEGYGGEVRGRIDYTNIFSLQGPFSVAANFREIRIEKCAWLRETLARRITGTLKGSVSFGGDAEALKNGMGNLEFTLTNGAWPLLDNLFGFDRLEFSKIDAKISFRNGALKITELTLNGEKLRMALKGNILLSDDIQESRIDLNGTIEGPVQGNRRMTLAISGTLGNAKMKFL
jgi:type II secretion system protein N